MRKTKDAIDKGESYSLNMFMPHEPNLQPKLDHIDMSLYLV
jgi:hypothetical protein